MNYNLIQKLIRFDILEFIKIEESYFKEFKFHTKKTTKEIIKLNFLEYSPYDSNELIYQKENETVSIWFSKFKTKRYISIPISYILTKYFRQQNRDGIFFIETSPQILLVIANGTLKQQLSKNSFSNNELNIIQKNFSSLKLNKIDSNQFHKIEEEAIKLLSLKDLFNFHNISFNKQSIFNMLEAISLPISILIVLLFLIQFSIQFYLESNIKKLENEYFEIREKTNKIQKEYRSVLERKDNILQLSSNINSENKKFRILNGISSILKESNATFESFKISNVSFNLRIDTNQTDQIFKKLFKTKQFKSLKITGVRRLRSNNREKVSIRGELKNEL